MHCLEYLSSQLKIWHYMIVLTRCLINKMFMVFIRQDSHSYSYYVQLLLRSCCFLLILFYCIFGFVHVEYAVEGYKWNLFYNAELNEEIVQNVTTFIEKFVTDPLMHAEVRIFIIFPILSFVIMTNLLMFVFYIYIAYLTLSIHVFLFLDLVVVEY